jgi:hypothetical protein
VFKANSLQIKYIYSFIIQVMTGWDNDDTEATTALTGPPDFSQGFGRISLDDVLLGHRDYPGQSDGMVGGGEKIGMYFENEGSISSSQTVIIAVFKHVE